MSERLLSTPPRRDARLNRAHILAVARQAFDDDGVDVSMDAIAKLAGVGAGTLYRISAVGFGAQEDTRVLLQAWYRRAGGG